MFNEYRNRMSHQYGSYMGDTMRKQSEFIADQLWMNSVQTYPTCVYFIDGGLPPEYSHAEEYPYTLYAHFESKSVYNAGGEEPTYYITFRPEDMRNYENIKVGAYVSLPNVHGKPEYWMIVHVDDDNQVQKCQILKCNHIIKWVHDGSIYSCLGVLRGGSDAEGVETNGSLSLVDSNIYLWVPTNSEINTIGYDTRFLISSQGRVPPLAWKVSAIKDMGPFGLTRFCLSQDLYNDTVDSAEYMIADYSASSIKPSPIEPLPAQDVIVTYNGSKPTIRIGSQKVFNVNLDEDSNVNVSWTLDDGTNTYRTGYSDTTITQGDYTMISAGNTLTLKVARNYDLVGTVLTVIAECIDESNGSIKVEVIS